MVKKKVENRSLFLTLCNSNLFLLLLTSAVCSTALMYTSLSSKILKEFNVSKIEFDGNEHVPDVLLLKTANLKYQTNVFSIPIDEVKKKLEKISWIKSVSVQRKLPGKIYVRIVERTPIAILQSNHKLYLLDIEGKILEHNKIGNFENLPILVGEDAEKAAKYFLFVLNKSPKFLKQLAFATYVGKRRWNITINKGITVKLPEKHLSHAMRILEEISDDNGFFNDDIAEIDLRIIDRVVLKKK